MPDRIPPANTIGCCARIDELQAEKRQLEIKIVGLESEIGELKARVAELEAAAAAGGPAPNSTATDAELDVRTFANGGLRR